MLFRSSSAPHYGEICTIAVQKSWRLLLAVTNTCENIQELCTTALEGAYESALQRKQIGRTNKFIVRYVQKKMLPFARSCGMADYVADRWNDDMEGVFFAPTHPRRPVAHTPDTDVVRNVAVPTP